MVARSSWSPAWRSMAVTVAPGNHEVHPSKIHGPVDAPWPRRTALGRFNGGRTPAPSAPIRSSLVPGVDEEVAQRSGAKVALPGKPVLDLPDQLPLRAILSDPRGEPAVADIPDACRDFGIRG